MVAIGTDCSLTAKGERCSLSADNKDMKKTFDWKIAETMHGPKMIALFRDLAETHISESVYVQRFVQIPMLNGRSKRGRRSPSYARNSYRTLKDKYGF